MEANVSYLPITNENFVPFRAKANALLASVKWTAKPGLVDDAMPAPDSSSKAWRDSTTVSPIEKTLSILNIAKEASQDGALLSEEVHHAVSMVRRGLELGMYMSSLYTQHSGLETLITHNKRGALTQQQQTEFREKYETASAIAVFAAAYYIAWELSRYKAEEIGSVAMELEGIPEVSLLNPVRALDCMIFYYAAYLSKSGKVRTGLDFVKLTLLYFEKTVNEIQARARSFKHAEIFSGKSYKLADKEFHINGFEADLAHEVTSIEFNRVDIGEIVGNRDAKHMAKRLAGRLVCYDPAVQKNPFMDLGGLSLVRMGFGEPGTGKSLQIAATATMLYDYCKILKLPFLFWPLPDNVVSTFQGGSAERMIAWMKPLQDPKRIIYGPIDDAENILEERTRQGVSAGVREVIAVFLRMTEGAYAIHRGNSAIEIFTNIPDQVDRAVLSRIMERVYIGGAQSVVDFLDQDYLWWKRFHSVDPSFVDMQDPEGYAYLSQQKLLKSMSDVSGVWMEPKNHVLKEIFNRVVSSHKPHEHNFFATFYFEVKRVFPYFTSRDVRNIQQAVTNRIMDFDLPNDWIEKPDTFFFRDYETKIGMLKELMRTSMKGLTLYEIRLQEAVRYLENMVRIAHEEKNRYLNDLVSRMRLQREAEKIVSAP